MKILLFNVNYGIGSTGKIVQSLFDEYTRLGHDVYCLYGRFTSRKDEKIVKKTFEFESKIHHLFSLFTENMYGGMLFSTLRIIHYIKLLKPDVVHIHCINGYCVNIFKLIKWLKKNSVKTILTNHAEFMFTANCAYSFECQQWINERCKYCDKYKDFNGKLSLNGANQNFKKMENSFSGFNNLIVTNVSPWLTSRSSKSFILKDAKINTTVFNPVLDAFFKRNYTNPYNKYGLKNSTKIVFFCTAYFDNPIKGGKYLIELAKISINEDIHFFVKSNRPSKTTDIPSNVTFINETLNQEELASYYHHADCSLILSERETFSMIVAESLCCGTPIIGFQAGGPESIAIQKYSKFVEFSNLKELQNVLLHFLSLTFPKDEISNAAKTIYSTEAICRSYLELYKK